MIGEIKDEYGVTIQNAKDNLVFTLDAATASRAAARPIQYETGFKKVTVLDPRGGRAAFWRAPIVG